MCVCLISLGVWDAAGKEQKPGLEALLVTAQGGSAIQVTGWGHQAGKEEGQLAGP